MMYSILEQALIALPLIMGGYLTLSLLKLPDFSIESAYLFGAVSAYLARDLPLPLVTLSALGGGMVVGVCVTLLNQLLHIPFLLAAIVTNGLFHGLTQLCLGTSVASFHLKHPLDEQFLIPIVACTLFVLLRFVMRSQLGYSLAIFGNNPLFFAQHSISKPFILSFGILAGHGCAGISGFLFANSNGFVDLTMNYGVILLCLSSLMIGKLIVTARKPAIVLPLLGVVAFFVIQQTLLRLGLNLKYFNAFQALFILAILYFGKRKNTTTLDHLGV